MAEEVLEYSSEKFTDLSRMLALGTRDKPFRRTLLMYADRFDAFTGNPLLDIMWKVLRSWCENAGEDEDVAPAHFIDEVHRMIDSRVADPAEASSMKGWAKWAVDCDTSRFSRKLLAAKLRVYAVEKMERRWRAVSITGSFADSQAASREVEAAAAVGLLAAEADLFKVTDIKELDEFMAGQRREPIGIPFIDIATGEGMVGGESMLVIMPSGAGKTTLALQACEACVVRGRHVFYFGFEQPLKGDIFRRLMVLTTGSERSDWAVSSMGEVSEGLRRRFMEAKGQWAEYFHFFETYQRADARLPDVGAIFDTVRDYSHSGKKPYLVIIDWWGLVKMLLLAGQKISDPTQRREYGQAQIRRMQAMIKEPDILTRLWVFHQMAGKVAAKKSAGSIHDGQEDSNLPQLFDIALTSSRVNPVDSTVEFSFGKARMAAGSVILQKLDGPRCRFTEPPDGSCRMYADGVSRIEKDQEEAGGPRFENY